MSRELPRNNGIYRKNSELPIYNKSMDKRKIHKMVCDLKSFSATMRLLLTNQVALQRLSPRLLDAMRRFRTELESQDFETQLKREEMNL